MTNGPEGGGQPLFRQTAQISARQRLARERAARTTRQAAARARREQARRDIQPRRRQVISQFRRIDTQVSGSRGGQPTRSATEGRVKPTARPKPVPKQVRPPSQGPRPKPKQVKPPTPRLGGGLIRPRPSPKPQVLQRPGVRPSQTLKLTQRKTIESQIKSSGVPVGTIKPATGSLRVGKKIVSAESVIQRLETTKPRELNRVLTRAKKPQKRAIAATLLKRDIDRRSIGGKGMPLRRKRRLLKILPPESRGVLFDLEVKSGRKRPRGFAGLQKNRFR